MVKIKKDLPSRCDGCSIFILVLKSEMPLKLNVGRAELSAIANKYVDGLRFWYTKINQVKMIFLQFFLTLRATKVRLQMILKLKIKTVDPPAATNAFANSFLTIL